MSKAILPPEWDIIDGPKSIQNYELIGVGRACWIEMKDGPLSMSVSRVKTRLKFPPHALLVFHGYRLLEPEARGSQPPVDGRNSVSKGAS